MKKAWQLANKYIYKYISSTLRSAICKSKEFLSSSEASTFSSSSLIAIAHLHEIAPSTLLDLWQESSEKLYKGLSMLWCYLSIAYIAVLYFFYH